MRATLLLIAALALLIANLGAAITQRAGAFGESLNHPAIQYTVTEANTVVDELNRKLADGSARLTFDPQSGYLRSVLALLNVPVESQVMVYSPTSAQAERITPQNPRAIYFNDTVAVGYVRGGGMLELVAQDPKLGSVFYVINQEAGAPQKLGRELQCLRCHLTWDTLGVPGMSLLSTFPRETKDDYADGFFVDHFRPVEGRWGGWYVTGTRVPVRHMGNFPVFMPTPARPMDTPPAARTSLEGQIDLTSYPTPYSDVAALMVLDHQVHATNLITRANWEARLDPPSRLDEAVDTLVEYLIFVDEAAIPAGGIEGSSGFTQAFQAMGPRDSKGRSLRDLDLQTRLQKYPLSYMIYSPAFDALPPVAKQKTLDRLRKVLSGEITGPKYAHLTPAIRQAITEILQETHVL